MKKYVLDNGIRLLTQHKAGARAANAAVFVGAGSRFECETEQGFSHFVEHMVFKGTTNRSALEIATQTDFMGGQLNAYTTKEYTCYYIRTLPEFGRAGLEMLADLVANPLFEQKDITTEGGVILEELSMYEDDPEELVSDGIFASAWAPAPLGRRIVGTRESVSSVTSQNLREFHNRYYRPENIVVAVSGVFNEEEILETVRKMLGEMPRGSFSAPVPTAPAFNKGNSIYYRKKSEQLQFCIAFPSVGAGEKRVPAVSLLNSLSGGGASSRLFLRLREELGLAYSLYSYYTGHVGCGVFTIAGGISPKAEKKTFSEIKKVLDGLRGGITEEELVRAKNQVRSGLALSYENSYNLATDMGRRELFGRPQRSEKQNLELISAVTLEQVNREAETTFDLENSCTCFAGTRK